MNSFSSTIRQCENPDCSFRFPILNSDPKISDCPNCGGNTVITSGSFQSPKVIFQPVHTNLKVEGFLDNIRSALNVGSMFRTADGADLSYMHLCGITPTPENPKVAKTALGSEHAVSWSHYRNGLTAIKQIKAKEGYHLWALEGGPSSKSLFETRLFPNTQTIVLVTGNEASGIDPEILAECEQIVSLPMIGFKRSLNAAVAFGIAVYYIRFAFQPEPVHP